MKKHMLMTLGLAGATVLGGGLFAAAHAATSSSPSTLAQKIASEFHIDASKVQAVIDSNHATNQAKHETSYEDRLTQAVTDRKLTAAQKALVLTEHSKLQAEMTASKATTGTDRMTAMKAARDEAKAWAKANSIDEKWLMGEGHHFRSGKMPAPTDN